MSEELAIRQEPSLAKGLLAGMIGGIVATAAKTFAAKVYPPRVDGEPEPPTVLAEKIAGHPLSGPAEIAATESIHWVFGALAGAAYGGIVEYYPAATSKEGASFGMALAGLTHQAALPALGLALPPGDKTFREETSEAGTHVIFGLVTEAVRKAVRPRL